MHYMTRGSKCYMLQQSVFSWLRTTVVQDKPKCFLFFVLSVLLLFSLYYLINAYGLKMILIFLQLAGKKKHVRPLLIERVQLQHEVCRYSFLRLFASLDEPFEITSWARRLPLPHFTRGRESNDCYKYIRTQLNT